MTGHGVKFGRKKDEAIVALLTHRNVEEAAKAVGLTRITVMLGGMLSDNRLRDYNRHRARR